MSADKKTLLTVKDLEITFGEGKSKFVAVQDANFDIYKGGTFSFVGESGSGKTTIGRAIIGLNSTSKGDIPFEGKKINGPLSKKERAEKIRKIQMIFQDPSASLNERAAIEHIISEGLYNFNLFRSEGERLEEVAKVIKEVELLPEHMYHYLHEFSGSQRQRIGITRALVMELELVVADEPISALDVSIRAQVLNLPKDVQKRQGVTYLFVARDLSVIHFISDRIAVIRQGHILELAEMEELSNRPIHSYTEALLSAAPIPSPILAGKRKLHVYDPSIHDYTKHGPVSEEVHPRHFVYGNQKELETYRKLWDL